MPRQNNFIGYAFTRKNPQKFDIPKGCSLDKLKDLIKQVAPKGNPPHRIHESQVVRRLFFWQPAHLKYSDKVIKFEISKLKSDDDVLKVLVESNYWKQFVPIEILALFSKLVMENEDEVVTSLQDWMLVIFCGVSCKLYLCPPWWIECNVLVCKQLFVALLC